jgi:hypothetical protein
VPAEPPILSRRALNRALLARQLLLERASLSALDAIEHLVGIQAQAPYAPYVGLWSRVSGFCHDDLADLIEGRQAVRTALMRNTIHLVSAADCLALRPVVQPVIGRGHRGSWGKRLDGVDSAAVAAATRELLADRPLTAAQLGPLLAERFPAWAPEALAMEARAAVPLVQTPPRGVWGKGGPPALAPAEAWLGAPQTARPDVEALVLRYLGAFGPAAVADVQLWSGLTRLAPSLERLRLRLDVLRDEDGRELFDLPDAPRPDPGTPAPVRFVPEYDNLLLSHADRSRVLAAEHREPLFTRGGLLVDGFVRASWWLYRPARRAGRAKLDIRLFRSLSKRDAAAVRAEGLRLAAFAAPGAEPELQFGDA